MTSEVTERPTPAQLMAEISESFAAGAVDDPYPVYAKPRSVDRPAF